MDVEIARLLKKIGQLMGSLTKPNRLWLKGWFLKIYYYWLRLAFQVETARARVVAPAGTRPGMAAREGKGARSCRPAVS
jgi:hypothetical protein